MVKSQRRLRFCSSSRARGVPAGAVEDASDLIVHRLFKDLRLVNSVYSITMINYFILHLLTV